jgi:hypothetical protein
VPRQREFDRNAGTVHRAHSHPSSVGFGRCAGGLLASGEQRGTLARPPGDARVVSE